MTSLLLSNLYGFDDVGKKVAPPLAKSLGPACHSVIVSLSRGEKLFGALLRREFCQLIYVCSTPSMNYKKQREIETSPVSYFFRKCD